MKSRMLNRTIENRLPAPAASCPARLTVLCGLALAIGLGGQPHRAAAQCTLAERNPDAIPQPPAATDLLSAAIVGDTIYVHSVDRDSGNDYYLAAIDISNGANPVLIGSSPASSTTFLGPVTTYGDSVAVGTRFIGIQNGNIQIYEMADPSNPVALGSLDLPGSVKQLEMGGNTLYALSDGRLDAVDISDPFNPQSLDSIALTSGRGLGDPKGNVLPLTANNELQLIDVSDPANLSVLDTIAAANGSNPTIVGNTVVIPGFGADFLVFDITDPTNIAQLPSFPDPNAGDSWTEAGRAAGSVYFVIPVEESQDTATVAIDFTDPSAPAIVDEINYDQGGGQDVLLAGSKLVTLHRFRYRVYNIGSCGTLPTITVHPFSQTTNEGGAPVVLDTVNAQGTTFQWLKDGQPIAEGATYTGTTTGTLTIEPFLAAAGGYALEVSNGFGEVTSLPAVVAVRPSVPAPTGACSFSGGDCLVVTEAACIAAGGNYDGDATQCVVVSPTITNVTQATNHATLADAIDNSAQGDVIEIGAGRLVEWGLTLSDRDITIRGRGRESTIIDGTYSGRVFEITGGDESTIEDLTIRRGVPTGAGTSGGGGLRIAGARPTIRRVDILECDATGFNGSAVDVNSTNSEALFDRCRFMDNVNGNQASALRSLGAATLLNCLFAGNGGSTRTVRPAIGTMDLINCTFANNTDNWAIDIGGNNGTATVQNCVFDGSNPTGSVEAAIPVDYSLLPGGAGTNIDGVPAFVDAANGDYRLAEGSLGIDAADYDAYVAVGGGSDDLDGDERYVDNGDVVDTGIGALTYLDMGAYELQVGTPPPDLCLGDMNSDGAIDGLDTQLFVAALLEGTVCP